MSHCVIDVAGWLSCEVIEELLSVLSPLILIQPFLNGIQLTHKFYWMYSVFWYILQAYVVIW